MGMSQRAIPNVASVRVFRKTKSEGVDIQVLPNPGAQSFSSALGMHTTLKICLFHRYRGEQSDFLASALKRILL